MTLATLDIAADRWEDAFCAPNSGLSPIRLADREVDVLRLLAAGLSTGEIAGRLCYSQRTIKGIIHDVTTRFDLRNRAHAVAFAIRAGII